MQLLKLYRIVLAKPQKIQIKQLDLLNARLVLQRTMQPLSILQDVTHLVLLMQLRLSLTMQQQQLRIARPQQPKLKLIHCRVNVMKSSVFMTRLWRKVLLKWHISGKLSQRKWMMKLRQQLMILILNGKKNLQKLEKHLKILLSALSRVCLTHLLVLLALGQDLKIVQNMPKLLLIDLCLNIKKFMN